MTRALVLVLLVAASPAAAQSALRHHNTDAPLDVDAKSIDVLDANGKAVFTGDVRVVQGDMKLNADSVTAFYSQPKNGRDRVINRIDAQNNVHLVTPSETASGRYGIYAVDRRTVTLIGGVTLTQKGGSDLHGQRLAIDLDTGRARLDGGSTGPAAPGTTPAPGGRVTGHFVVPQRNATN
ncbi:MAG: OstA family protein [Sphingomonadaceae bacterium]|nr:OstA family protein [Sphingomonadaceae bacterium]